MANDLSVILSEQLALPSISEALPKNFNRARFVQNSMALLADNPDLRKYEQAKLIPGLLKGAYLGLDFYNKECYLIPYGSELQFQLDYSGMQKLIKKYAIRPVKEVYARIVREGDEFSEEVKDNNDIINFKPKPFNEGKIIGAFAKDNLIVACTDMNIEKTIEEACSRKFDTFKSNTDIFLKSLREAIEND